MNRRDALKGAALPLSLIAGTALSTAQPAQHEGLSWGPQPHYHVVYAFQWAPVNDFLAMGVYTNKDEADAHVAAYKQEFIKRHGRECHSCLVIDRSHEEFCYEQADYRLAAISEHMRKLMRLPVPQNVWGADSRQHNEIAELYGKSEFPSAIERKGVKPDSREEKLEKALRDLRDVVARNAHSNVNWESSKEIAESWRVANELLVDIDFVNGFQAIGV